MDHPCWLGGVERSRGGADSADASAATGANTTGDARRRDNAAAGSGRARRRAAARATGPARRSSGNCLRAARNYASASAPGDLSALLEEGHR